jgi:hypothetical protein
MVPQFALSGSSRSARGDRPRSLTGPLRTRARPQQRWAQPTTMRVAQQAHRAARVAANAGGPSGRRCASLNRPTAPARAAATPVGPADDDARHPTGPPRQRARPQRRWAQSATIRVAQQAHPTQRARAQRPWAQPTTIRATGPPRAAGAAITPVGPVGDDARHSTGPPRAAGAAITPVGPVDDDARHSTGPPLSYLTPGEHELVGYGSNELWGVHRYEARECCRRLRRVRGDRAAQSGGHHPGGRAVPSVRDRQGARQRLIRTLQAKLPLRLGPSVLGLLCCSLPSGRSPGR